VANHPSWLDGLVLSMVLPRSFRFVAGEALEHAFVTAAQAGVPVVPAAIRGTRVILRPEHHFPRRGPIDVTICQPIRSTGTYWAAAVRLQRAARDLVLRLSGEPDVE
jgi:1-acyl-sn-glycerol-3-phosphate acyltransferase